MPLFGGLGFAYAGQCNFALSDVHILFLHFLVLVFDTRRVVGRQVPLVFLVGCQVPLVCLFHGRIFSVCLNCAFWVVFTGPVLTLVLMKYRLDGHPRNLLPLPFGVL